MKTLFLSFVTIVMMMATASDVFAQKGTEMAPLPHKAENLDLYDLNNKITKLPYYGEKNILVFYVDPDRYRQNDAFTHEMEENKKAAGPNIEGFGIINLKDTMFPNSIVRALARHRTAKNGATIITDPDGTVAKQWQLGDCNNVFMIMIITKEGELVYCSKGELTYEEQQEFYRVVDKYR